MSKLFCLVAAALVVSTMHASAQQVRTYPNPKVGGVWLDWCLNWAVDCGKPAADAYCRTIGFVGSRDHAQAPNVGRTRLITGQACNAPYCSGFRHITCWK